MNNTSMILYLVSWGIAIFIHFNTLRRTALYNTKEAVIDEIYSLIETHKAKYEHNYDKEAAFAHKNFKIERKINELNSLYIGKVVNINNEKIKNIFTFDPNDNIRKLTTICYDSVEHVEQNYHIKVQDHFSILKSNKVLIIFTIISIIIVNLFIYLAENFKPIYI